MARNPPSRTKKLLDKHVLEAACLDALKKLPGYERLNTIEVRPAPRSRQGANWKIALIELDIAPGPDQWRSFKAEVEHLMTTFDLAIDDG